MRKGRARLAAASISVLSAVALLSGCGGGSNYTLNGMKIKDADKSLASVTAAWKTQLASSDKQVNVPKDARCFMQVAEDVMTDTVICGPVRYAESEATTWEVGKVFAISGEGGGDATFMLQGSEKFKAGKFAPNAKAVDADGKEADSKVVVDEPDAPEATPGQPITDSRANSGSSGKSVTFWVPGGSVTVKSVAPTKFAGQGQGRKSAPNGGVFVPYAITANLGSFPGSTSQFEQPPVVVTVTGGGETVEVGDLAKKDEGANGQAGGGNATGAAPVKGDGKDATITITVDGKSFAVTPGSDTLPAGAQGFPLDNTDRIGRGNCTENFKTDGDASISGRCAVEVQYAAWAPGAGWAPDGKEWAIAYFDVGVSASGGFFGPSYGKFDIALSNVKIGDVAPEKQPAVFTRVNSGGTLKETGGPMAAAVPVDKGGKVSGSVTATLAITASQPTGSDAPATLSGQWSISAPIN